MSGRRVDGDEEGERVGEKLGTTVGMTVGGDRVGVTVGEAGVGEAVGGAETQVEELTEIVPDIRDPWTPQVYGKEPLLVNRTGYW